jgi:hypothetical protein
MLNQQYSKIKFIKNKLDIDFNLENVESMSFKKDELYYVENNSLVKQKEIFNFSKNIFSIYVDECFDLYKNISIILKEVCNQYDINIEKQKYMIFGKLSTYGENTNKNWYDFPGINIPQLHGFYFIDDQEHSVSFKNNNNVIKENFYKNEIFINKPTDLINIKVKNECKIVEFYIYPMLMLKHNEPGVWIPII